MTCPNCKIENDDNWLDGLCQMCWEASMDKAWWTQGIAVEVAEFQDGYDAFVPLGAD